MLQSSAWKLKSGNMLWPGSHEYRALAAALNCNQQAPSARKASCCETGTAPVNVRTDAKATPQQTLVYMLATAGPVQGSQGSAIRGCNYTHRTVKPYLDVLGVVWEAGGQLHEGGEGILTPHRLDGGARQHCLQDLHKLLAADRHRLLTILQRSVCLAQQELPIFPCSRGKAGVICQPVLPLGPWHSLPNSSMQSIPASEMYVPFVHFPESCAL